MQLLGMNGGRLCLPRVHTTRRVCVGGNLCEMRGPLPDKAGDIYLWEVRARTRVREQGPRCTIGGSTHCQSCASAELAPAPYIVQLETPLSSTPS